MLRSMEPAIFYPLPTFPINNFHSLPVLLKMSKVLLILMIKTQNFYTPVQLL